MDNNCSYVKWVTSLRYHDKNTHEMYYERHVRCRCETLDQLTRWAAWRASCRPCSRTPPHPAARLAEIASQSYPETCGKSTRVSLLTFQRNAACTPRQISHFKAGWMFVSVASHKRKDLVSNELGQYQNEYTPIWMCWQDLSSRRVWSIITQVVYE